MDLFARSVNQVNHQDFYRVLFREIKNPVVVLKFLLDSRLKGYKLKHNDDINYILY